MSLSPVVVGHEELGRFIRDALTAKGASTADAAIVADGLVWANLRGVDGHGVSRLPFYLQMISRGEIDAKARPRLTQDRAATFVLDCGHGFGLVAMMQAIAIATERARAAGSRRTAPSWPSISPTTGRLRSFPATPTCFRHCSRRCRGKTAWTRFCFRASARAAPKPRAANPAFRFQASCGRSWEQSLRPTPSNRPPFCSRPIADPGFRNAQSRLRWLRRNGKISCRPSR